MLERAFGGLVTHNGKIFDGMRTDSRREGQLSREKQLRSEVKVPNYLVV